MKILAVEDERKIADFIRSGLEAEGHVVDLAHSGTEGLNQARAQSYDAVVLDIMLPEQDGLDVLRSMRREGLNMPVVLVTARGQVEDRVEGLQLGADDYLVKPFYVEELAARLQAVSRRTSGEHLNLRQYGDLTLNLATREVRWGEQSIELTSREFNMLEYFMRSPGRVYTRPQILEHVWQYHFDPGTNLVDVYIKRLRQKLTDEGAPPCIETVRGVGYRLAA
ncbi:response regulator transcription factor [Cerasicoccus maritimus]|uniref:response regulator transcription factor n=1 Tax=Cerasicoccus maritimus TaxID=490089 RepID=UPI002852CD77|nr:response regulator transcription factor [Cerasicoccus maritimus]